MRQLTNKKTIRISNDEANYLDVLENVYNINTCKFIRLAIMKKLRSFTSCFKN